MDIGRITDREIRRALEHLRQARPLDGNPLLKMALVEGQLRAEGLTDTPESRGWALAGLLETIIRANLRQARGADRVAGARAQVLSSEEVKAWLAADFQAGQPDREAWSCLYYRYFAPHDLQVAELAAFARPGSRHGRKYVSRRIERGLQMLTGILHELELAADQERAQPDSAAPAAGGPAVGRSATAAPRHNLPAQLSRFVGREAEIVAVTALLDDGRLMTLTGAAGAGKTRLALEVAVRLRETFAAGTWFVSLAGLADPRLVAHTLADALGETEDEGHAPLAAVIEAIGDQGVLIVLDNCEHLIEASAILAEALLQGCPEARVLATSRELLDIDGEQVWPVLPLGIPPAAVRDDPASVAGYPAVQLFVQRAHAADPRFRLDAGNCAAVAELCARLDGLPLALELAAARIRLMSPAEMLARLDERFTLLDHGRRTADPRQRTLWAAIDWSHTLLSEPEQVLLRRLSVFREGCTVVAAEQVCADEQLGPAQVQACLAQLVDKSLLSPAVDADGAAARHDMLESIRDFARVKCREAGEERRIHVRHLRWCVALAEEAGAALTGPDQGRWLNRLALEAENLRQALAWAAEDADSAAEGLRLVALLTPFWRLRGRPSEGRYWIQRLLDTPVGAEPSALRAKALDGAGALAFQQGDYAAARALHTESLAIHRQLGNPEPIAESLRHLGNVADETGDYAVAVAHYDEALAIWRATDNAWGEAATLNNLGLVALRQGDYDTAEARLADSLARFRALGTDWAVAVTLSNLGDAALARADGATARQRMADSLTLARRLDDHEGIAYALTGMAHAECLLGHPAAARRLLGESLVVLERMGSQLGQAEWLEVAALLLATCDQPAAAVQVHAAVDALRSAIDSPLPPKDRPAKDVALTTLRAGLGDAEFESLWLVGATLRWQDAAALVMGAAATWID